MRNLQIETKHIKKIIELFVKTNDDAEIKYDNIIKSFVDEANKLDTEYKNYTPERSAKILASMKCFLRANNIEASDEFQDIFKNFESIFNNNTTKVFAKCAEEINILLYSCKKRSFLGRVVYFLGDQEKDKILEIEREIKESLKRKSDIKKFKITKLINLINPEQTAVKYSVRYVCKYQKINKLESVEQCLPAHFKRHCIFKAKEFFEMLSAHNFNKKQIATMTRKHNTEMKKLKEEYDYLMLNSEQLDVRIISSSKVASYPIISYYADGRTYEKMLKSEIPNALWFNPNTPKEKMTIEEFINSAMHSFGDIYYMPIKKNKGELPNR